MNKAEGSLRIAIVGMGPRGLGALEALRALRCEGDAPIRVDVFDPFPASGAGPNFDPDESQLCLLNIPHRDISIRPPEYSRIGSFANWLPHDPDPDAFPARADLGRYLEDRYEDLRGQETYRLTRHACRVDALKRDGDGWLLQVSDQWHGPYDEVLLTLGQPKVRPDDQLAEWQQHADGSRGVLAQAYPAARLAEAAAEWSGKSIAIRGMGLSAFDVLRVLTCAQGGRFENGRYIPSGREPERIYPFSLDGKPPFPKPATQEIDERFTPTEAETNAFTDAMAKAAEADVTTAKLLINTAITPVALRVLSDHGAEASADRVLDWLETEWDQPGAQEEDGPLDTLLSGMALAEAKAPPTIGYTVGQLWRKWQDQIRAGYNPAKTPPDTAKALLGFDEGLKRYSYGPPLSASRELLALIEADLVDLALATDPKIETVSDGWALSKGDASATVGVMVDAVLPSPDLGAVRTPLVSQLLDEGRLTPLTEGLSADTAADGRIIDTQGQPALGLCLLGRLALGSVVAADSLHDCFGEASRRWARGVLDRQTSHP